MNKDNRLVTIILAAGKGKRMKSDLPKVLHPLAGKPLVHYVIELARSVGSSRILLIVGYGR
jgi:bifunctional UDP-N-acetylglucosamine pyrophosphorylase/glucosamine-1-phosphate N-acetyltransferase